MDVLASEVYGQGSNSRVRYVWSRWFGDGRGRCAPVPPPVEDRARDIVSARDRHVRYKWA
jgi:hypothetical protein